MCFATEPLIWRTIACLAGRLPLPKTNAVFPIAQRRRANASLETKVCLAAPKASARSLCFDRLLRRAVGETHTPDLSRPARCALKSKVLIMISTLWCRRAARLALGCLMPTILAAYGFLTHEAIIDLAWDDSLKPVLLAKYPRT